MKKTYLTIFVFCSVLVNSFAQNCSLVSPCDSVCPDPQIELIAQLNKNYTQTITMNMDTTGRSDAGLIPIDSVVLDSVIGLPEGIIWGTVCGELSPCPMPLIGLGCLVIYGSPTVAEIDTFTICHRVYIGGQEVSKYKTFKLRVSDSPFQFSTSTSHVSSFGLCDGFASINVSGGSPPYSYQWSSEETTQGITNKCSDKYTVVVTDADGISDSTYAYISEPSEAISNFPAGTSAPDTIINNLDTCIINYDLAIDSAFIRRFTITDSSHIIFDYEIYQGGVKSEFSIEFEYDSTGQIMVVLQLNCTGSFTRMLKSTRIESVMDVNYSEIGVTQTIGNLYIAGINSDDKLEMLQVYPNPFEDYLTMNVATSSTIQISDATGRLVYIGVLNSGINTVNTAAFGAGVYLISVTNEEGVVTRKVMKK